MLYSLTSATSAVISERLLISPGLKLGSRTLTVLSVEQVNSAPQVCIIPVIF